MLMRKKRKKSIIVRLLVIGVAVYMTATLVSLWKELNESKSTLLKLQEDKQAEIADIDELRAVLDDDSKSAMIEKAARERLGFAYPYEEIYKDISGN